MTSIDTRIPVRWACLPGLLVILFVSGGCASGSGNVSGKVTYLGQPVTTGTIVFYDAANNAPSSPINPDGSYALRKVAAGKARIVVMMPMAIPFPGEKKSPSLDQVVPVPPKYADPEQSGLSYEVKWGSQTHDVQLD